MQTIAPKCGRIFAFIALLLPTKSAYYVSCWLVALGLFTLSSQPMCIILPCHTNNQWKHDNESLWPTLTILPLSLKSPVREQPYWSLQHHVVPSAASRGPYTNKLRCLTKTIRGWGLTGCNIDLLMVFACLSWPHRSCRCRWRDEAWPLSLNYAFLMDPVKWSTFNNAP